MAEADKTTGLTDQNPGETPIAVPADSNEKKGNSGCLILFLLAIPLVDAIGVMMPAAGPYANVVALLGWCGFACGAAVGAYVSVRIKKQHWWSSCRWAIYGILGMCLFALISIYASIAMLKMQ